MTRRGRTLQMALSLAAMLAVVPLAAAPVEAALILTPTTEFSGSGSPVTIPAGDRPTATFATTGTNEVTLTMQAFFDTAPVSAFDNAFIGDWYFNVDPALTGTALTFTHVSGITATVLYNINQTTTGMTGAQFKADGDGVFDLIFDFPQSGDTFNNSDSSVWIIRSSSGTLTEASFDFPSVDGPAGKSGFTTAAHIQNINGDSGWYGDNGGGGIIEVAMPGALLLLGSGLMALRLLGRREVKK